MPTPLPSRSPFADDTPVTRTSAHTPAHEPAHKQARTPAFAQQRVSHDAASTASQPAGAAIHERVLSLVAARICGDAVGPQDGPCIDALSDAAVQSRSGFLRALARLQTARSLSDTDIVDAVVPAVARQLGDDWSRNRRSFAEVTIGTARLVATVRELSAHWTADAVADARAPRMAMYVPADEQHRLGASVAASRFRRLGVSVRMIVDCDTGEAARQIGAGEFDLVCISLATPERVEQTRRVVHMVRGSSNPTPPIIVGGPLQMQVDDLKSQVGADHAACEPEEALRLCGLMTGRTGEVAAAQA